MIRVAINGFGRIGRQVCRAWLSGAADTLDIVAINDPGDHEVLAHLFAYDSIYGPLQEAVSLGDGCLQVAGKRMALFQERDPSACPWERLAVDVVLECSGFFASRTQAELHLQAGAKRVLISAPAGQDVDRTVVYGVNHQGLDGGCRIASNASCTTNCLAPLLAPIHDAFEVVSGLMTTIHAYTGDQKLVDAPHPDPRRARAAALSMIPTKTGAAAAIGQVIPDLTGRLDGYAVRVPTASVSVVDVTLQLGKQVELSAIDACLRQAACGELSGVLGINDQPLVSVDFKGSPYSCVADLTQTRQVGSLIKLVGWYDNEWAFARRMLDVTAYWVAC